MKRNKITSILLLLAFFPTIVAAAKFYKWTDEEGNIHYSDKVPLEQEVETVHVNSANPPKNPYQAPKLEVPETDPEAEANAEADAEREAQQQEFCKGLRSNIKTLEVGGRIQTIDEDGNRKFLDDEERANKLNKYKNQLSEHCS